MPVINNYMQAIRQSGPVLWIGLALPFVLDNNLSDPYFMVRMILLGLALSLGFWLLRGRSKIFSFYYIDGLILGYATLHWVSSLWSINVEEALTNNLRLSFGVLTYFFWRLILNSKKGDESNSYTGAFHLLALIYTIVASIGILKFGLEYSFSNKDLYRMQYPGGHKSLIAEYILLLFPFVLFDTSFRKLKLVTIPIMILAIIILQSRAAFVGLIVLGVLYMGLQVNIFKQRKWKIGLGVAAFLFIGIGFILRDRPISQRLNFLNYTQSQTAQERVLVWNKTISLIKEKPFLGHGSGNWKIQFPSRGLELQWVSESRDIIFTRAHNDFFEIATEVGILGLLLWLAILGFIYYNAYRQPNSSRRNLSLLFITSYIVISILDFPKERVEHIFLFWTVVGFSVFDARNNKIVSNKLSYFLAGLSLIGTLCCLPKYFGERHLYKALNARAKQDWAGLIQHSANSKNVLYNLDPYAIPIAWYEGLGHYQLNQLEEAHLNFLESYQVHPFQYHVLNNLATTYFQKDQLDSALVYYEKCLSVNPYFEDARFNQVVVLTQLKRFDEAKSILSDLPESEKKESFREQIKILELKD